MRRLALLVLLAALVLACGGEEQRTATYLALGDSLAFGTAASDPSSKGYVPLVHKALQESDDYEGVQLEMLNLGEATSPGLTSADMLKAGGQLERAVAEIQARAEANPVEVITIDIGGNDFLPLAREGSPCVTNPASQECLSSFTQTLTTYQGNLGEILTALRQAAPAATIVVLGVYNNLRDTPLAQFADLFVQQLNGAIARAAGDSRVEAKFADPSGLFRERSSAEVISSDGVHPTDAGYALLAEAVLAALAKEQARAHTCDACGWLALSDSLYRL